MAGKFDQQAKSKLAGKEIGQFSQKRNYDFLLIATIYENKLKWRHKNPIAAVKVIRMVINLMEKYIIKKISLSTKNLQQYS